VNHPYSGVTCNNKTFENLEDNSETGRLLIMQEQDDALLFAWVGAISGESVTQNDFEEKFPF
jgi:hypothetical protein